MKIIVIHPNNAVELKELSKEEQINDEIDGYLEALYLNNIMSNLVMFVDEDGKMKQLKVNKIATLLYGRDLIVGTAILVKQKGENVIGLSDKEIELIMSGFLPE